MKIEKPEYKGWSYWKYKGEKEEQNGDFIKAIELYSEAIENWDHCQQDNLLDKSLNFYVSNYLQNGILTKLDRSSMLNSLETRSPFLDLEFVDFVRKIPSNLKLNKGVTKYILKKACPLLYEDFY